MFANLFRSARSPNEAIVDALYGQIVAAARQPVFYAEWQVPDTPLGRFEMIALHMVLFLRRTNASGSVLGDLAQEVTDEFFKDVDHSLRELGIGDVGVPKRMKKLARMFYGRAGAYGDALDAQERTDLSAALMRNVRPGVEAWKEADSLAGYAIEAARLLSRETDAALLDGQVAYPAARPGVLAP